MIEKYNDEVLDALSTRVTRNQRFTEAMFRALKNKSAFVVDIDNEMEVVVVKAGKAVRDYTFVFNIHAFYGRTDVTDECSFTLPEVEGMTIRNDRGVVSVGITEGTEIEAFLLEIRVKHIPYGEKSVFFKIATIEGTRETLTYQIASSLSAFAFGRDDNGELTPKTQTISFRVKETGEATRIIDVPSHLRVAVSTQEMPISPSEATISTYTITPDKDNLFVALFDCSSAPVLIDTETIPVVRDGLLGRNSILIDLDNENDTMLYNGSGELVSGSVVSHVRLYDGERKVDGVYSLSSVSGCTATIDADTITVSSMSQDSGFVDVKAVYKGNEYTTRLTLKRLVGTDKYELIVTPTSISYNRTKDILSNDKIEVLVYITKQNGTRMLLKDIPSGYSLKVADDEGERVLSYNSKATISVDMTKTFYRITLYKGAEIIDTETIPLTITEDGARGASVKAQYSPDKKVLHDTYVEGDVWMRTCEDDVWGEWLRIVGEAGDSGDYIDSSFGISNILSTENASVAPSDVAVWHDAPINVTDEKPYLWCRQKKFTWDRLKKKYSEGDAIYFRLTGEKGKEGRDSVVLSLDNEMDAVPCDNSGKVVTTITLSTRAKLYKGTEIVDFTLNGDMLLYGVTPSITKKDKAITISWTIHEGTSLTDKSEAKISTTYNGSVYESVFTASAVKGGKAGETPIIYQLKVTPSTASFGRDTDGKSLTPATRTLIATLIKREGRKMTTSAIPPAMNVRWILGESVTEGDSVSVSATTLATSIRCELYEAGALLDSEDIPILKDGIKGEAGSNGDKTVSEYQKSAMSEPEEGRLYPLDIESWQKVQPLPTTQKPYVWSKTTTYVWDVASSRYKADEGSVTYTRITGKRGVGLSAVVKENRLVIIDDNGLEKSLDKVPFVGADNKTLFFGNGISITPAENKDIPKIERKGEQITINGEWTIPTQNGLNLSLEKLQPKITPENPLPWSDISGKEDVVVKDAEGFVNINKLFLTAEDEVYPDIRFNHTTSLTATSWENHLFPTSVMIGEVSSLGFDIKDGFLKVDGNDVIHKGNIEDYIQTYTLPAATESRLGGVKVGTNLSIDKNGVLSATNTKNTAGATNTDKAIYLIGATSQAGNPQTYTHADVWIGTDNCLYSNRSKVLTESSTIDANAVNGYHIVVDTKEGAEKDTIYFII